MPNPTLFYLNNTIPVLLGGSPVVTIPQPHVRWPIYGKDEEIAVSTLLQKGEISYYRLDGVVKKFEEAFTHQMGLPYAISTHSGTGAIHAGWFALNLPPGAEVIVPAYTHIGTALPLLHLGLSPVLCDIDKDTGNIDPEAIKAAIGTRTRAIAVTHQFGLSAPMKEIKEIAEKHNLKILEDCSHAHGSKYNGHAVGTFGDVACFSLQSHKSIPVGEGGILLTKNPLIAERASLLGHFRQPREFMREEILPFVETGFGLKSRLHPLAAAIGLVGISRLDQICQHRKDNYEILCDALRNVSGLHPLKTPKGSSRGGYFRFVLLIDPDSFSGLTPEQIVKAVQHEGATEVKPGSLARPLHSYRIFNDPDFRLYDNSWLVGSDPLANRPFYKLGDFPQSEYFSSYTIQLPAFTNPSEELIHQYANAFAKIQCHAKKLTQLPHF